VVISQAAGCFEFSEFRFVDAKDFTQPFGDAFAINHDFPLEVGRMSAALSAG
jgi:hypothetical protein